jgi:hypothetical protein
MATPTTPTVAPAKPAAPAGGPPAAPKNAFDDFSAGAAWFAIFVYHARILNTFNKTWAAAMSWLRDYRFERNHRWTHWVRMGALVWMGILPVLLFGFVPEAQWTTRLLHIFAGCEGTLLLVVLSTWVPFVPSMQVRSATTFDLRTFRDAAEKAQTDLDAAEEAYIESPTVANDQLRVQARTQRDNRRDAYQRFLRFVGPSNRPAPLLALIAWVAVVRFGFGLVGTAEDLHGYMGLDQDMVQELLYTGVLVYFLSFVIPVIFSMYAMSFLGSGVVKIEKGAHMARQVVQGVLTPGGVTSDTIDAKERLEDLAEGHEPGRMATDTFVYRYWMSCVSMLLASFVQMCVILEHTLWEVSKRSAKYAVLVTCVELLIYWMAKDPTLRRKKESDVKGRRWLTYLPLGSLVVVGHFFIMGGVVEIKNGKPVYGPASAWLHHGPLAWLASAGETVADNHSHLWDGFKSSLQLIDFSGGQVIRTVIVGILLIGGPIWALMWIAKKTAPDKDAVSPLLKSGRNFAFVALGLMTVGPGCVVTVKQLAPSSRSARLTPERQDIVQQLDRYGRATDRSTALTVRDGANRLEADNARRVSSPGLERICALNSLGYTRCTGECFQHHHWLLPPGQTIADMQSQGRCYTQ